MRWTGVAEPAASLAAQQQAAGYEVWVGAIWERSLEEGLTRRGLRLARQLEIPRRYNPLAIRRDILRLRQFLIQEKIDVVHCHLLHDHWLAALAVRGIPRFKRPALVRTVHRYEPMRRDPWHRWLFAKATDLIITVSTEQKNLILHAYAEVEPRLAVIFGGVNPQRFKPGLPGAAAVRADMGEKPGAMVAGLVAHLGYNRGHKWLLRASVRVVEQLPNATIWIVGQGELKHWLRAELRKPQYQGRVLLTGYRKEDLAETYCAMDCALLLGLGSEGSARAALEAMATGRPVIAVERGALIDTIRDGVDGFLVHENDDEVLAEALIKLLSDNAACKTMGAAARQRILDGFTEEKRFEATEQAYQNALQRVRAQT